MKKSINCNFNTQFNELKNTQKKVDDFIAKHNTKCPHEIKSRPHRYWDAYRKWEYSMALTFTDPKSGQFVLDVGSANSVLAWYLASKGVSVLGVDLLPECTQKANENNEKYFKYPNIKFACMDVKDVEGEFDYIYSICVFEHFMEIFRQNKIGKYQNFWQNKPTEEEWGYEKSILEKQTQILKPGGILVTSFDMNNNNHCAYLRNRQDIINRIIKPSKLELIGGDLDISDDNSPIGIVFLKKKNV
jgi:2-polyprenyl-3-methyl-5-hydroxy-6-metoxy-1,4-benzoquinol methylase